MHDEAAHISTIRRPWFPKVNPCYIFQQLMPVPAVRIDEYRRGASIAMAVHAVESHRETFITKTSHRTKFECNTKAAVKDGENFLEARPRKFI